MNAVQMNRIFITIFLIATSLESTFGNAFRNPPAGGTALGRHGGNIVFSDDASAINHNPANIADTKQPAIQMAVTYIHSNIKYTSLQGATDHGYTHELVPNAFVVIPIKEQDLTFGLGITTPFGSSTKWKGGALKYTAPHFSRVRLGNVNPTLAKRFNKHISIGIGADIYYSDFKSKQFVPWAGATGAPFPDGESIGKGDGEGFGGNAAIRIDINENQAIGFTYRSAFDIDYDGHSTLSYIPAPLSGIAQSRSDFGTKIKYPNIITGGYGIKLTPELNVGIDIEWIEFSRYKTLPIDLGANNSLGLYPSEIPQKWDDSWNFLVGMNWDVNENFAFRLGYGYLDSPIPSSTIAPSLPDMDRHLITTGLGISGKKQSIDLAFGVSIPTDRNISNNVNPNYTGRYKLEKNYLIELSYEFKF